MKKEFIFTTKSLWFFQWHFYKENLFTQHAPHIQFLLGYFRGTVIHQPPLVNNLASEPKIYVLLGYAKSIWCPHHYDPNIFFPIRTLWMSCILSKQAIHRSHANLSYSPWKRLLSVGWDVFKFEQNRQLLRLKIKNDLDHGSFLFAFRHSKNQSLTKAFDKSRGDMAPFHEPLPTQSALYEFSWIPLTGIHFQLL